MKAFNEIDSFQFSDSVKANIKSEVIKQTKDYILGIDEEQYKAYLYDKYALTPLVIDFTSEEFKEPVKKKEQRESRLHETVYEVDVYQFRITYKFEGSADIFKVHSNPWNWTSYEIQVDEYYQTVSLNFNVYNQNAEEFHQEKNKAIQAAFSNLENANNNMVALNNELPAYISSIISTQRAHFSKENDFFTAIRVPVNKDTQSLFIPSTTRKKIIPQPMVSKTKQFASEPTMSQEMYDDLLKLIYDIGKGMERKPSLYKGKDENGIRDVILHHLEFRYEAATASGETFNSGGKTDIILKYAPDGTNLFIAECKFWTGHQGYLDTISQLFDRYLTWRDSKAAVIMFVRNKDFVSVLKNIANETRNHPYFVKEVTHKGESSFSYIFHLKSDQQKKVQLQVMAFHFDKA
jgi:hypothetical protein